MSMKNRTLVAGAALAGLGLLAGCSGGAAATPSASSPAAPTESKTLTVVTHDSFALSDALTKEFAASSGYTVKYVQPGDGGALVNQLILSKDSPLGDVVYGIDNTFAGRALAAGVVSPYTSAALPASAGTLQADDSGRLTPIDFGDVCVNADRKWFAARKLAIPATLDDLAKPEYKNLLVVENPASSSPGLAWLTATVGAKGDPGYLDYWAALAGNGVKVVKGWTEAYSSEFSGSSGKGSRPLVVSYHGPVADLFPPGGVRRGDRGRAERGRCAEVHRLPAEQEGAGRHSRPDVHVPGGHLGRAADGVAAARPARGAALHRVRRDHLGQARRLDPRLDGEGARVGR